mmetsp:Transcript_10608/g.25133  ORF Transcript_10608/g.25133 Transcript_10608/m.25133 type:complete len:271 (-) Transcript_10608:233-1045(-)
MARSLVPRLIVASSTALFSASTSLLEPVVEPESKELKTVWDQPHHTRSFTFPSSVSSSSTPRPPTDAPDPIDSRVPDDIPTCENKSCLGFLYYSQGLHDRNKSPVCIGARTTPSTLQENLQSPTTGLVDFKYVCAGYSVYQKPSSSESKNPRRRESVVYLPYCEGLEVISSREAQESPVLLKEGPDGGTADEPGKPGLPGQRDVGDKGVGYPAADRNFVRGTDINLEDFPTRFERTARKILSKMAANLKYMATTLYQFASNAVGRGPKGD